MKKKRVKVKDKELKQLLKNGGRKGARRDFFELIRRAAKSINKS